MTVREIAKLAKVSPTTVSIVLNNKGGVSDETRKKVLEIAEKGGYKPKSKEPARESRKSIRFIKYKEKGMLAERNGDFITRVIDGIEDEARNSGIELKITNMTSANIKHLIEFINEEDLDDGIIFLGTEFKSTASDVLKLFQAPLVVIDNSMKFVGIDCVVMDNDTTVYMAVNHLYHLGHRKIGHIRSEIETDSFKARHLGFRLVMEELGLTVEEKYVYKAMPELDSCYESMKHQILQRGKDLPSAFFADNDTMAIGALRALKDLGIKVPEEVSVIGIDDLMISSVCEPKLTTIRIHNKTMGHKAVIRLMEIMNGENVGAIKIFVGSELIVRESTSEYKGVNRQCEF